MFDHNDQPIILGWAVVDLGFKLFSFYNFSSNIKKRISMCCYVVSAIKASLFGIVRPFVICNIVVRRNSTCNRSSLIAPTVADSCNVGIQRHSYSMQVSFEKGKGMCHICNQMPRYEKHWRIFTYVQQP